MKIQLKTLAIIIGSVLSLPSFASTTDTIILVYQSENQNVKEYQSFKEYQFHHSKIINKIEQFEELAQNITSTRDQDDFKCNSLLNVTLDGLKLSELNRRHLIKVHYKTYKATRELLKTKYNSFIEDGNCKKYKLV